MDTIATLVVLAVFAGIGVLVYLRLKGAGRPSSGGTGGGISVDSPLELDDRL